MSFKFEKLIVWQKALDLSEEVHQLTKGFPKEELHILTSQIERAADSVALNIAEGSTGQSNAEFKRFLRMLSGQMQKLLDVFFLPKGESICQMRISRGYIKGVKKFLL